MYNIVFISYLKINLLRLQQYQFSFFLLIHMLLFFLVQKANFVDSKMTDLLQKTTRIMTIVEELGDMVHSEASSEIVKQSTSYKKMIELWDGPLHSGGTPVKAAFYDALKKHEPELVKSLGMIYSSMCICCLKVIKSLTIFFPLRWLNPRRPKMFQITLFSEFFQ